MARRKRALFSELIAAGASAEEIVVTFLAILELYKRGEVTLRQDLLFGDIEVATAKEEKRRR
jgi:segregation and condensation protein A